jgi:hypothetical protein
MRRAQWRGDRVEGVGQRTSDRVAVQVRGALLDVPRVTLEPLVVVGRDPEAEHVHLLRLALEARGQLLGDEHVRPIGDRERAVDRVVIGDRHEVHAAPLRELVHLLRRRGALGQPERALNPEARLLRRGRVAVEVDAAEGNRRHRDQNPGGVGGTGYATAKFP